VQARLSQVLVVEDDEDIRLLMQQVLKKLGCQVMTAANGGEAKQHIEQESLDLVLLDVMMPVVDGFEVLEWTRERFSMVELPVIMVTALSENDYVVRALQMGANDYVSKPFNFSVMQARVNTQLMLKRLAEQNNEFLRITSHDLRKNVALISDVISVMGERVTEHELDEDFHEACSLIKTSAGTMKRITEDFLELQVIHDGNIRLFKSVFDINELIMRVIEQDQAYAKRKGVMLKTGLDTAPPLIRADATRLEQVLANLIGNAIKFSQPGTTTWIRSKHAGSEILVEVCDEGPGFLPEEIDRVFHQQGGLSNRPTGGEVSTGMGLMICDRFIRLHDGRIGVLNNCGPGATFWFSLPFAGEN
jgi:signal transduction histidine kinase